VPPDRDAAFQEIWTATSRIFRAQPGFLSLRLHRAVSPDAQYRFLNVVQWTSLADFRAAHATEEFRSAVRQAAWAEFPSSPALYEVVVELGPEAPEPAASEQARAGSASRVS